MYVFKRGLDDDSDWAHLTSFGIEFQTEEEAKENERSPSVALLCAGLLCFAFFAYLCSLCLCILGALC